MQVRVGPSRFNHSKCYILGDNSVFIGSSNLTAGGMVGNHELNAGLYQPGVAAETRRWFDRMWAEATDAKEDLLRVLRLSKFGVPPDPHNVYMKMLFEKYKPFLQRDDLPRRTDVKLTMFQRDAVSTSMHIMSLHGGTIIADSTGLGKTNMGIEIIRQKILNEGKKAMLVAPAQVLRSVWSEKLKEVDIAVRHMVSMESMGRENFMDDVRRYRNIDFVVIDESQNFRSKNAQRRHNLMRMLSVGRPKQVLLLTATPINNSLMDLYYQLCIITKGEDDHFWESTGIVDLYRHMRDATNRGLDRGLYKIQQLLDAVMVRRTRSFIRDVYKDDEIDGRKITFPGHEYRPIRYDLAGLYGNIFEGLYDDIRSLTMAPYSLERYNTSLPQEERDAHKARAHLQVVLLLKRFESSTEAVRVSIGNKIRMYEHMERTLRRGNLLRVKEFNAALAKWGNREIDGEDAGNSGAVDDDPEDDFVRVVADIAVEKAGSEYDVEAMLSDTLSDLKKLRTWRDEIARVQADKKFEAVRDAIIADGALDKEGRKVLIFTEYTVTARHLHKKIKEAFGDKEVLLIHGGTSQDARRNAIRRFAPLANLAEGESLAEGEGEVDVLVSTEVLSEGQNLQDCNYVVNYDLPWNPMRIVQRTGRVDRLTSRHGTVRTRACYPDRQLDDLLQLIGKLMEKIDTVDEVVGMDVEVLGKMPNPKEFNGRLAMDIKALAGQGATADNVIGRLETESDMMPQLAPINEIMRHIKEIGSGVMGEVPMGRRSGKRGEGQKAVLAYLQEGGRTRRVHFVVYDYATDRAEAAENDADALRLASCAKAEPVHLPMDGPEHRESFEELLWIDSKARQAIADRDKSGAKKVADLRKRRKRDDRNVSKLLGILVDAVDGGQLPEDDANAAYNILSSAQFRLWPGKARELLGVYEADGSAAGLVRDILQFGRRIYVEDRAGSGGGDAGRDHDATVGDNGSAARLVLVAAQFVMDKYNPLHVQEGLERHME